jgi:hypothetical protein
VQDDKVRDEHSILDGLIYPVDDPFWDTYMPPNGWNCRCFTEQLMASELPDEPMPRLAEQPLVLDPTFHNNPGKTNALYTNAINAVSTNWQEAGLPNLASCPQNTAKLLNIDNLTRDQAIKLYSDFLGDRIFLDANLTPVFLDSSKAVKLMGNSLADLKGRLRYLPELEGTLAKPLEKWFNPRSKRCYYIKRFKDNLIIMAEINDSNTLEYFNILPSKDGYANSLRSGILMYKK